MFKCDYHTHTYFSFDGEKDASPEALCEAAIARGITDLAITDHFECNWKTDGAYPAYNASLAYEQIMHAKEKYKDQLHLTYGIELGQSNQCPEEAMTLLDSYNYEFVIGSIHNLRDLSDFYFFDFSDADSDYISTLFDRNIDELCEVINTVDKIDTVAHITYMHRYIALAGKEYNFSKHAEKLSALFMKMVSRDIALEVNLSTVLKGLGFSMPDRDILSLYRDCGGKLVTVGTDAHSPKHVGSHISDGFELLRSAGLNNVLVVRNGEKTIVKI